MRKFVQSRSAAKLAKLQSKGQQPTVSGLQPTVSGVSGLHTSVSGADLQVPERDVPEPSISGTFYDSAEVEELRKRMDILDVENTKLKQITDRLLNENISLKERQQSPVRPPREREARRESRDEPKWAEVQGLVEIITQENEFLLKHISQERSYLRTLKHVHMTELNRLTEELHLAKSENSNLEKRLEAIRIDRDKVETQLQLASEDLQGVIPLHEHKETMKSMEKFVSQLKTLYSNELEEIYEKLNKSQHQLKTIAVESVRFQAEMQAYKDSAAKSGQKAEKLQQENELLRSQLTTALEGKTRAEQVVKDLLILHESLTKSKNS